MKERRSGERFKLSGTAEIAREGKKKSKGELRDLSINGAFIAINNGFEPYEDIEIAITVRNDRKSLAATLKGVVSRKDGDGIGVQFTGMDMNSFRVIRDIAKLYAEDPKKIEKDIKRLSDTPVTR
ncbi:MAG TPA: PilZ domain-containing protein [bacterium]|nr:PilZ domain-containing protein [bacterium]